MAKATKTIIKRLDSRKPEWFQETQQLFNQVAAFYFEVIQAHERVLEQKNKESLRVLEIITVTTKDNPDPIMPLPYEVPAMFRRAAINAALGSARSFYTTLRKYHTKKAQREAKGKKYNRRPPVPPREWNRHTTFYQGMMKGLGEDRILLKLYTGSSWAWVKFEMQGRGIPEGWNTGCPQAIVHKNIIHLHFPVETKIDKPQKVAKQVENPELRICAVDLNLGDRQAVGAILKSDGTEIARRFWKGGDFLQRRRNRLLGKVAVHRSEYGEILPEDVLDNVRLWDKVRNIEDYEAHRLSRRIVEFAQEYGATVIVFEHLVNLKPEKGRYSKRSNTKRAYWLKGRLFKYTRYKAWEKGIITSRVNPRNTSKLCSECGVEVYRHNEGEIPKEYRMGAPLFTCTNGHRGNADLNASRNIGAKLFARYKAC
ncbi:putative transposase DNA-binding domain protein [Peptococcaceae bacterium CEB3]|nr:putative transposase DNA-binding domain protein [Peptococcaceae bacterium CEB3]